jgi:hypothetical protein
MIHKSKAFSTSQKMLPAVVLLFKVFNIPFVSLKMESSVAMPFLKPKWLPTSYLLVLKRSGSLIRKPFSKIFEKEVDNDMGL